MADSETSLGRPRKKKEEEKQPVDINNLIQRGVNNAIDKATENGYTPPTKQEEEEEENQGGGGSVFDRVQDIIDNGIQQPEPEPEPQPEPQPAPQSQLEPIIPQSEPEPQQSEPEPQPAAQPQLTIQTPQSRNQLLTPLTFSDLEAAAPAPTAEVTTQPQAAATQTSTPPATSRPRTQGYERAERYAPTVQQDTAPVQETNTVQRNPLRTVDPRQNVPQSESDTGLSTTPANTYQEWLNYIQQQEQAQEANDELFRASLQQQEPTNGYVRPVTQRVLGTYPTGTMDFLQANDLPVEWLNTPDGQYWLESQTVQQPEILFPSDVETVAPPTSTPREPEHYLGAGPTEPGTWNYTTATGPRLPRESGQEDYNTQVRILMGRGYPQDTAEQMARAEFGNYLYTGDRPTNSGYVDTSYLRENPGEPYTPLPAADLNRGDFQAFLELGRDQGLTGRELVEYAADELSRNPGGNGYVPTNALRDIPAPTQTGPENTGNGYTPYTYAAAFLNANESDGWLTQQASDLYDVLPAIDPETPGAEILEQQRRDRMNALARQIQADDELSDDRPKLTGKDVKAAVEGSQLADVINDIVDWANGDESDVTYNTTFQSAQDAAANAGLFPGTAAYENFVNDYVQEDQARRERNARQQAELEALIESQNVDKNDVAAVRRQAEAEAEQQRRDALTTWANNQERNPESSAFYGKLYDDLRSTGVKSAIAEDIMENPENFHWNENTGRWERLNTTQTQRGPISWEDAVGSERLLDDLMQMNAPAPYVDENGEIMANTAAEALFDDRLTPEQKLHLFDRNGSFFNEGSGVNIQDSFAGLVADDSIHASQNPELAETITLTKDEERKAIEEFLKANPLIQGMLNDKTVSIEDIKNNFFKNVAYSDKSQGGASGDSSPRGGSGAGTAGKNQVLTPSYGQGGQVVKAPYKAGGYTEAELKAMGNNPYITPRGYTGYEGYYYAGGKWYPVDQEKANYYNRYGTYRGFEEPMRDYYNTFGTFSGYTPTWQDTGRRNSGGSSYYRGGSSYNRSSNYSPYSNSSYYNNNGYQYPRYSQSPYTNVSMPTSRGRNTTQTAGYYYGNNNNAAQANPTASNQTEQRINNIMKNWSF